MLGNTRKVRTINIGAAEFHGSLSTLAVTAQATPNAICVGSATSLQATLSGSTDSPFSYSWTAPAGATLSSTCQNPTSATAISSGVLSFSVRITDSQGCQATNTVSVTANTLPSAAINPSSATVTCAPA